MKYSVPYKKSIVSASQWQVSRKCQITYRAHASLSLRFLMFGVLYIGDLAEAVYYQDIANTDVSMQVAALVNIKPA